MWQRQEDYVDFVNQAWNPGPDGGDLLSIASSLEGMQSALTEWNRNVFGSVRKKLKSLRDEIEQERTSTLYRGPTIRERDLMKELAETLAREEEMEKQRARMDWLKSGDRNTGFFQAKAKARARSNRILALKNSDGLLVNEQEEIERVAIEFYQGLFTAQENLDPGLICQYVPRKVTDDMAELLTWPFDDEEVERALFQMGPSKAPGADGFTAGFFQKHWSLVKEKVTAAVLGFLNGGEMPEVINRTILVLILKVANPQEISQFRPISLCNVIYKICSKVLANRLRLILDDIISEEQSAFVPGRLITDNVLIAYECIHYLHNKKGKSGACAIKLDMVGEFY